MNAISAHGRGLYALLPEIYRQRDAHEPAAEPYHLLRYLDSHGVLLDLVRGTLEQMYADHFPDIPDSGRACQAWIVPYLADLVGAKPVSPFADGQRDEVANAIRWSKRKGTLVAVQEIVEQVALSEAEIQEGWQRVVVSARPDDAILPAVFYGQEPHAIDAVLADPDPAAPFTTVNPQIAARHPGLRVATVDMRETSRAIQAPPGAMGAHATRFNSTPSNWPRDDAAPPQPAPAPTGWRQDQPHGAPCFPDSYEDVSQRTVDLRSADPAGRQGRYHPKALVLYMPPPFGLCPPAPIVVPWPTEAQWAAHPYLERILPTAGDLRLTIRNKTASFIQINDALTIGPTGNIVTGGATLRLIGLRFVETMTLAAGAVEFEGCAVRDLVVPAGTVKSEIGVGDTLFTVPPGDTGATAREHRDDLNDASVAVVVPWPANPGDWIDHPYLKRIEPGIDNPGRLIIRNKTAASILIAGNFSIGPAGTIAVPAGITLVLEKLRFDGTLTLAEGTVQLDRCAVREFAFANDAKARTLHAHSVLFSKITGGDADVALEFCTILDALTAAAKVKASETIFPDGTQADNIACARYSRLPPAILDPDIVGLSPATNSGAAPLFVSKVFGSPGAGVLRPDASVALLKGAEDGTEIGAFHDWRYSALRTAILRKLNDYLPLGEQPVIVWDPRLLVIPPTLTTS